MMQLTLYHNNSDKRFLTKQISEIKTVNVFLFEPCELDKPVFKLKYDDSVLNCNYLYAFGAYYFCEIEFQPGGICFLHCHKDVLMSNREKLIDKKFEIVRQEKYGFSLLSDTNIMMQNNFYIDSYRFTDNPFTPSLHSTFVLQVVGGK